MDALLWIDRFLSNGLRVLLVVLLVAVASYLGGHTIFYIYRMFFEYKESFWDLSNAEIIYILLYIMVIYRHVSYCIKFKADFWHAIFWPFSILGCTVLIYFAFSGGNIYSEKGSIVSKLYDFINMKEYIFQMVAFLSTFLAIYISTPTSLDGDALESESDTETDRNTEQLKNQEEKSI